MTKVPQGFDFSFLNEEEARKILQVLERNEDLRRAEKDRIRYEANSSSWAGPASCWFPREPRDTCWDPMQVLLGVARGNEDVVSVGLQMPPGCSLQALHPQRLGWESRTPQGGGRKSLVLCISRCVGPRLFRTPGLTSAGRGSGIVEAQVRHRLLGIRSDRFRARELLYGTP